MLKGTVVASMSLLLASTALAAGNTPEKASVDQLPKDGYVTLTGTVDAASDDKSFTLRDAQGKTIDVESNVAVPLNKGDQVRVTGQVASEFLGIGKEINQASVSVISTTAVNAGAADANEAAGGIINNSTLATGYPENDADEDEQASAIKQLPETGAVNIEGTVAAVDRDDNTFTLRDDAGKTIDVHASKELSISEGDRVTVKGLMRDDAMGMGDEIQATSVQLATN